MEKIYNRISPTRLIVVSFAMFIFAGAFILMLPISSANGCFTPFVNALFTSTSAVCVTGLAVYETGLYWSMFGKFIIIILIQVGGIGTMTVAGIVMTLLRKKISLSERMIMTEASGGNEIRGIVGLVIKIVKYTFISEALGALLLMIRFAADFPLKQAIVYGLFHSVSAFCNAGFDILCNYNSFEMYSQDIYMCIVLSMLIVTGGLGFFVWQDVFGHKRGTHFSLHTKIVSVTTAILIVSGTALIFTAEYTNRETIGFYGFGGKLTASFFQSVTSRTAGFAGINQGNLTSASKLVTCFLMFVGGSPGSTAGGIKTVTFLILNISVLSFISGRSRVNIFNREIEKTVIMRALTVITLSLAVILGSIFVMCIWEKIPFEDIMFEAVSAYGTTGLSTGITSQLCILSKFVLIFLMFFGRVGIISFILALRGKTRKNEIQYPIGKIIIG